MSSTTELDQEQLAAARASAWKQAGEPLLTLEAARDWVNELGLVLFAPRPQLAAPAPSLVEATLGRTEASPSAADSEVARGLLARLVGEGLALPLNLLGGSGDTPDFVVSAQVFSYVFTMRGDKLWKQPPSTSDSVKVSPLGLRIFEALTEKGTLTARELAAELGREVTETAIVRALVELWAQLRVIPLLSQQGSGPESGGETLWELTTRRFTKAIKAGANAGQPTALSALVSLYLAQVYAATEEEAAAFLSPLTARSRVREVLHALLGARQLETLAIEGKTLLHIPGTLPEAVPAVPATAEPSEGQSDEVSAPEPGLERPRKVGTGRISSFSGDRAPSAGFRGKPVRSLGGGTGRAGAGRAATGSGRTPARNGTGGSASRWGAPGVDRKGQARSNDGRSSEGRPERERRPFSRDGAGAGKPAFTRPWEEDRSAGRPSAAEDRPRRDYAAGRPVSGEGRAPRSPERGAGPQRRSSPERGSGREGGYSRDRGFHPDRSRGAGKPRDDRREAGPAASAGTDSFRKFRRPAPEDRAPLGPREQAGLPPERRTPSEGRGAHEGRRAPEGRGTPEGRGSSEGRRPSGPRAERGAPGRDKPYRGSRPEGAGSGFKRASGPRSTAAGARPFAARPSRDGGRTAEPRPFPSRGAEGGAPPFRKTPARAPWGSSPGERRPNRGEGAGSRPFRPRTGEGSGSRPAGGSGTSSRPAGFGQSERGKSAFGRSSGPSRGAGPSRGGGPARGAGYSSGKPGGFSRRPSATGPSQSRPSRSGPSAPRRRPEAEEAE